MSGHCKFKIWLAIHSYSFAPATALKTASGCDSPSESHCFLVFSLFLFPWFSSWFKIHEFLV
jgi:hypothetical protein